ncbi:MULTISPECIES: hypothetical protein [Streptomyces]|uniref:hypothetical protein n=1 Tax=Streptomyces TaxID=1883 RepID=UPI0004C7177B|nr:MULTISPECIES: hypothetical protein [Streptomyces]
MASVIDPEQHGHLIELQRAVFEADAALEAYSGDDAEPLREAVRQAVLAKDMALVAAGLVEEHGHYIPRQDLKKAAKDATS